MRTVTANVNKVLWEDRKRMTSLCLDKSGTLHREHGFGPGFRRMNSLFGQRRLCIGKTVSKRQRTVEEPGI